MNSDFIKFNCRMPKALAERADSICCKKGISRNAAINMSLADWVANQEKIDDVTSKDVLKEIMLELAKSQMPTQE